MLQLPLQILMRMRMALTATLTATLAMTASTALLARGPAASASAFACPTGTSRRHRRHLRCPVGLLLALLQLLLALVQGEPAHEARSTAHHPALLLQAGSLRSAAAVLHDSLEAAACRIPHPAL